MYCFKDSIASRVVSPPFISIPIPFGQSSIIIGIICSIIIASIIAIKARVSIFFTFGVKYSLLLKSFRVVIPSFIPAYVAMSIGKMYIIIAAFCWVPNASPKNMWGMNAKNPKNMVPDKNKAIIEMVIGSEEKLLIVG